MADGPADAGTTASGTVDAVGSGLDRTRLQIRAEQFVRENRFTIAVVFPMMGALMLVGSAEGLVPGPLSFNPYLVLFGTAVMRLPLLVGVAPLVDRRSGALIGTATVFSYAVEIVGVATGWPYGAFTYQVDLGPMISGVPLGLPVFYLPLVLNAYLLVLLLLGPAADRRLVRLPATLLAVVAVDLVLDPGAVAIGFWQYAAGGSYYGVPASNYAGWVLSGLVTVTLLDLAIAPAALRERLAACEFVLDDLVSFVLLWGAINAAYGNWLAVGIAAVFVGGLIRSGRFDFDVWRTAPGIPDRW
ncbi:MAG: bisanhydrobacterioruberin hydratase [Halobacteriales archaeon]